MGVKKTDIITLLEQGKIVQIRPKGYSMYPMLIPNRDSIILKRAEQGTLKRGDVVLYRREEGILVLHRIWKMNTDGIFLVGDNQELLEGPLRKDQIKGILVAFIRKGKKISVNNPFYLLYSRVWLMPLPLRFRISKFCGRFLFLFRSGYHHMGETKSSWINHDIS
jgi:signal peptidase